FRFSTSLFVSALCRSVARRSLRVMVRPGSYLISGFFLCLLAILPTLALAQSSFDFKYTQNIADSTLRSHFRVDPSTLGLSLQIPLGKYGGRGSGFPIQLNYSSKVWGVAYKDTHEVTQSNIDIVPPPGDSYTVLDSAYGQHSVAGWNSSLEIPRI